MPIITKNKIVYNETDFLAGLHPQQGIKTIPQKFGKYSIYQQAFNPFINLGYAQNGYLNTNITNYASITSRLVSKGPDDEDSDFYALEEKGKLHSITDYTTVSPSGTFPHTITDAVRCFDMCKYNISGIDYYFYGYRTTTVYAIDIGRLNTNDSTFDDDYMSTVPSGAAVMFASVLFNPMTIGHDDIMYIGGQHFLASYDGPNNTFVQQTLILPSNYNIVGLAKYPSRSLAIFAQGNGKIKVYFWDYLSLDPYDIKEVNDFDLLAVFEYKDTIGCITKGREGCHKIQIFNGSTFEEVARFNSTYNGKTINGPHYKGVQVNGNEIWFSVADSANGYLCCYGNNLGIDNTLNVVAKNDVYVGSSYSHSAGLLSIGRNGETLMGNGATFTDVLGSSSPSGTQYLDKTKYSYNGSWYSDLTDIGYERIQIKGVTVYFADEFTGGRTISVSLYDRYTTYPIKGLTTLGTATSTNRIFRTKPFNNTGDTIIPPLDGIGIKLDWDGGEGSAVTPIINKIVLDYEPVPIN